MELHIFIEFNENPIPLGIIVYGIGFSGRDAF